MEIKKVSLRSMDVAEEKRERLKQLFPSVFVETVNEQGELVESVDLERLQAELGTFTESFESRRERYGLDWPGKRDALRIIQEPSVATLKPERKESVRFDQTENLFIEGDNLEVLKLLQKSYYGKIKMIYIDPPYNTGKEFIYPDNYSESLETYLAYAGLVDDDGRMFATNTSAEGRYHTKWLNMMYPRLYLARNLLSEDGVIFISIDDHELSNLRKVCDEIFGEENLVANIIWQHSVQPKGYTNLFSVHHNYILCYKKSEQYEVQALPRTAEDNVNYSNPDNDPNGPWRSGDVRNSLYRPNLIYDITTPSGKIIKPPENGWRWSKETMAEKMASGEIVFSEDETRIIRKIYLKDQQGRAPETIWFATEVGSTRDGIAQIKELFDGKAPFDTVKPVQLIKRMFEVAGVKDGDIVLDFFAGSCSTAHAVLQHTNARFIVVQLPEPVDETNPSGKNASDFGLTTVADIGKERLRRVITDLEGERDKIKADAEEALPGFGAEAPDLDLGFKVFKLDKSCFKTWDGSDPDISEEQLIQQLDLHVDHVDPHATAEDILYELLLKSGFMLTEQIEQRTMAEKTVYSVADGDLLICLEDEIPEDLIQELAAAQPKQVICLDRAFAGNDQLKANAVHAFAAQGQAKDGAEQTIFKTV
jgi:adenine-specific DNA-methyltransferase